MNLNNLQNPSLTKMIICVQRRPNLSRAEFQDYWIHHHAPLALKVFNRGLAPPMLGYIQNHTLELPELAQFRKQYRVGESSFDGLTEVWLSKLEDLDMSDSMTDELVEANQMLIEDESTFVSMTDSSVFAVVQSEAKIESAELSGKVVKLVLCLTKLSKLRDEELQPLRGEAIDRLLQCDGVVGYTQNSGVNSPLMNSFREIRGMIQPAYDSVIEIWLDKEKTLSNPSYLLELMINRMDLTNMDDRGVDLKHSSLFVVEPHRVF